MKKEFCVYIKTSEQVTEDRWELRRKSLKVDSNTTIGEIEKWYRKFLEVGHTQFEVVELQQILKPE